MKGNLEYNIINFIWLPLDDQEEAIEEASNNDEYEPYEPEEELDYEPKPESPAPM